ncbi:unnamed protein product [Urochloa humidicola]
MEVASAMPSISHRVVAAGSRHAAEQLAAGDTRRRMRAHGAPSFYRPVMAAGTTGSLLRLPKISGSLFFICSGLKPRSVSPPFSYLPFPNQALEICELPPFLRSGLLSRCVVPDML